MTLLVPFDGSTLAEAALDRAVEFGRTLDESVLAVAVVPQGNVRYARERAGSATTRRSTSTPSCRRSGGQVRERAPDASVRVEHVPRDANTGSIARKVRETAREAGYRSCSSAARTRAGW